MPDSRGYSQMSSRLLYGACRIIPDDAKRAIQDHLAAHPGMCKRCQSNIDDNYIMKQEVHVVCFT